MRVEADSSDLYDCGLTSDTSHTGGRDPNVGKSRNSSIPMPFQPRFGMLPAIGVLERLSETLDALNGSDV